MEEFKTLEELYQKVKPALSIRIKDYKKIGINNITEEDIWNYLSNNIWKNKTNLTLFSIVNDIMLINYLDIINDRKKRNNNE